MWTFARTDEQKKRSELFIKRTLPVFAIGIVIGYLGLVVIRHFLAGSLYLHLVTYLWMAVFIFGFFYANQIFVVQEYRQKNIKHTKRGE